MIIVTGASRGLGLSICKHLLNINKNVLGLARNTKKLDFPNIPCDVSNFDEVKNVASEIKSQNLKIEGLINAAGVASMNLALTTPKIITEKIININLLGTIYCCQLLTKNLLKIKSGTIINFSTIAVSLGIKGESIYVASKAGVEGFTKSFAREMADFGITVNCIAPGPIKTDLLKGINNTQIQKIISQQIINKNFSKQDICDVVEILLDNKSKSLSGQIFHIGGV